MANKSSLPTARNTKRDSRAYKRPLSYALLATLIVVLISAVLSRLSSRQAIRKKLSAYNEELQLQPALNRCRRCHQPCSPQHRLCPQCNRFYFDISEKYVWFWIILIIIVLAAVELGLYILCIDVIGGSFGSILYIVIQVAALIWTYRNEKF
jgi:hypothetical protein